MTLDHSVFEQYVAYVRSLAEGNFGISLTEFRPVTKIYAERIGDTIKLFGSAFLLALTLGILLSVYAAVKRDSPVSTLVGAVAFSATQSRTTFSQYS